MEEQKNNIRVLFTAKANSNLDGIMRNFRLEDDVEESAKRSKEGKFSKIVIIDHLAKDFARENISEKDMADYLQKDFEISQQVARQISKEIITKIIPFLEKVPEEKFKDPIFIEEVSKKIFGTTNENPTASLRQVQEDRNIFPKIEYPENTVEPAEEKPKSKSALPSKRIKKPIAPEETLKPITQTKQPRGPDNYREPIE